jgi:C-terminal processing protease CtpA/Prc
MRIRDRCATHFWQWYSGRVLKSRTIPSLRKAAPTQSFTFLVIVAAVVWAPLTNAEVCRFDAASMQADLEQLSREVTVTWAYLDARKQQGLNLDALFSAAANEVQHVGDGAAFDRLLKHLVSRMADGHGFAFVPCALKQTSRWPFRIVETEVGMVVSESAVSAVVIGDVLDSIAGAPVGESLAAKMSETPGSTTEAKRALALSNLQWSDSPPVRFQFTNSLGRHYSYDWSGQPQISPPPEPQIEWRHLQPEIGYLHIRSFAAPDQRLWAVAHNDKEREPLVATLAAKIRQAFSDLAQTHALILDLRSNPGGTDLLAAKVASALLPAGFVYYQLAARGNDGRWLTPSPWRSPPSADPVYKGKLIVLIDALTDSAADNLVACLKDLRPNTTFVGQPTAGSSGAPRMVVLKHTGARVTFCTIRVFSPNGTLIEGHGVEPDRRVTTTRRDILDRRDAALNSALSMASSR